MKKLNLSACKTNKEVCKLIKEQVLLVSYRELLEAVNKKFIFQEKATKAIYTGLSMNMNVFLSGPGGYGKTTLTKWVLEYYKIPYHTVIGYKDMPVDALLGIPNMKKLINDSEYDLNFGKSIFSKPGVLLFEEASDVLPATAAALKDVLTERGFRNKNGKVESLIASVIITANKGAKEIVDDESKKALYEERFPISAVVSWDSYNYKNYSALLDLYFPKADNKKLLFLSRLFEYNFEKANNCISPRQALAITEVFLDKGLPFLDSFNLDLSETTYLLDQAKKENNILSFVDRLDKIRATIERIPVENRWRIILYAICSLDDIVTDSDTSKYLKDFKKELMTAKNNSIIPASICTDVDEILNPLK